MSLLQLSREIPSYLLVVQLLYTPLAEDGCGRLRRGGRS